MTREDLVSTGSTDEKTSTDQTAPTTAPPFLRVVKGDPTPEELAALVTVLAGLAGQSPAAPRRTPEWNAPRRLHRVPRPHGPGGWRASALPR